MKFVRNLLCLWRSFAGGSRIFSSAVAADHFNFRVGEQPGFDRLLPAVWEQFDGLPPLEVNQQGTIDLAFFPRPVIDPQDPHRWGSRAGDGTEVPKQGGGADLQAKFGSNPGTDLSTGGQTESDECLAKAIREAGVGLHQGWQPFSKDLLRTGGSATDKFPDGQSQDDAAPRTRQIRDRSAIVAVDTVGRLLAQRTARGGRCAGNVNDKLGFH